MSEGTRCDGCLVMIDTGDEKLDFLELSTRVMSEGGGHPYRTDGDDWHFCNLACLTSWATKERDK